MLQFPKPALQLEIVHAPPVQAGTACARLHALPHAPQFMTVVVAVSQPSPAIMLQFWKPVLHDETAHVPVEQVPLPLSIWHGCMQPPQFITVVVEVSQPSAAPPEQSAKPIWQVKPQLDAEQVEVAPAGVLQRLPHVPQCAVLVPVSTQLPPQSVSPAPHPLAHAPALHTGVAPEHETEQLPHVASLPRF